MLTWREIRSGRDGEAMAFRLYPDGTAPVIDPDGTMDYETALNWVNALNLYNNGMGWLNHITWQLPDDSAYGPFVFVDRHRWGQLRRAMRGQRTE